MAKPNYEWKKTVKKFAWGLGYVIVCGLLYMSTGRPEAAALLPILMAAQNFLKHKLQIKWL